MSTLSDLERTLGHVFADRALLARALTHASVQEKSGDNERLEFVGDRVLGLVIAAELYRRYPQEPEGSLARRHTGLVQQSALDAVATRLNLASHVRQSGATAKGAVLSDAVEALIGAVFAEGGYAAAERVVTGLWTELIEAAVTPPQDPKTQLQEWAQERSLPLPQYKTLSKSGADHAPQFEVEVSLGAQGAASAQATSKRAAEKEAARRLLQMLESVT